MQDQPVPADDGPHRMQRKSYKKGMPKAAAGADKKNSDRKAASSTAQPPTISSGGETKDNAAFGHDTTSGSAPIQAKSVGGKDSNSKPDNNHRGSGPPSSNKSIEGVGSKTASGPARVVANSAGKSATGSTQNDALKMNSENGQQNSGNNDDITNPATPKNAEESHKNQLRSAQSHTTGPPAQVTQWSAVAQALQIPSNISPVKQREVFLAAVRQKMASRDGAMPTAKKLEAEMLVIVRSVIKKMEKKSVIGAHCTEDKEVVDAEECTERPGEANGGGANGTDDMEMMDAEECPGANGTMTDDGNDKLNSNDETSLNDTADSNDAADVIRDIAKEILSDNHSTTKAPQNNQAPDDTMQQILNGIQIIGFRLDRLE